MNEVAEEISGRYSAGIRVPEKGASSEALICCSSEIVASTKWSVKSSHLSVLDIFLWM